MDAPCIMIKLSKKFTIEQLEALLSFPKFLSTFMFACVVEQQTCMKQISNVVEHSRAGSETQRFARKGKCWAAENVFVGRSAATGQQRVKPSQV